jgi:hypothetical protein
MFAASAGRSTCVFFSYDNHQCVPMIRFKLVLLLLFYPISAVLGWGFFAHKQINKHAVFTLPPAMFSFYKKHIHFITENAINPDKRCHVVEGEAPRHYIDLEYYYGDSVWRSEDPWYWFQAVEAHTEDVLMQHGVLPWHIYRMKHTLTEAFRQKDVCRILRLSADIGHYIADANVPLHTSENYNGQFTGQEGIHALWETRLPELFLDGYDFFVGTAEYVSNPQKSAWKAIITAHEAVSSVLNLEKKLSEDFSASKKYSFEQRGSTLQKVYSTAYAQAYHKSLDGQVERQMRASVKMVGDFWLTCWVDAGQPDLDALLQLPYSEDQLQEDFSQRKKLRVRACGE